MKQAILCVTIGLLLCVQPSVSKAQSNEVNHFFLLGFGVSMCMMGAVDDILVKKITDTSYDDIENLLQRVGASKSTYDIYYQYKDAVSKGDERQLDKQMLATIYSIAELGNNTHGESGYVATLFGMWAGMITMAVSVGEVPKEMVATGKNFVPWLQKSGRKRASSSLDTILGLGFDYQRIDHPSYLQEYIKALYTLVASFSV